MKARFVGKLRLEHLDEPVDKTKWFKTFAPFAYIAEDGTRYDIPIGTYTDFASIPKMWRWLIDRFGRHSKAALLHDYLTKWKKVPRKKADRLLREACQTLLVKKWKWKFMYFGVRSYSIATFKK